MITDYQLILIFATLIWFILSIVAYEEIDMIACLLQGALGFYVFYGLIRLDIVQQYGQFYYVFPVVILFWSIVVLSYGFDDYRNRGKEKPN